MTAAVYQTHRARALALISGAGGTGILRKGEIMLVGKHVYQGRSAELAAKAEIIARGYNVADWEVEVGADFLVTRQGARLAMRVEVKSNRARRYKQTDEWRTHFKTRRSVVIDDARPDLYLIFAARIDGRWEYLIISRRELLRMYPLKASGQPPFRDLTLKFNFTPTSVHGPGGHDYQPYRNNWPRYWPPHDRCE